MKSRKLLSVKYLFSDLMAFAIFVCSNVSPALAMGSISTHEVIGDPVPTSIYRMVNKGWKVL